MPAPGHKRESHKMVTRWLRMNLASPWAEQPKVPVVEMAVLCTAFRGEGTYSESEKLADE